jgi:Cytochrome c7 and related cytochrome c
LDISNGQGVTKAPSPLRSAGALQELSNLAMKRTTIPLLLFAISVAMGVICPHWSVEEIASAQKRRPKRVSAASPPQTAPRGSATRYSAFVHSSEKHKSLTCNACHKLPTSGAAKRDFPDVADFPNHDACVRCHRQQFFTRQAFIGTGPAICTVCHVRVAPREDGRFSFGKPNLAGLAIKPKDERQFTIEFPHDKHQNVIASARPRRSSNEAVGFIRASFFQPEPPDDKKPGYNNCAICHVTSKQAINAPPAAWPDSFVPPAGTFKTQPHAHDACFDCHWKGQKPTSDDCAGCHKASASFVPTDWPTRKSAKFVHEGGGEGGHVQECTSCHINITRASTLRGLTPDVPIAMCASCHNDNKKVTWKKIVSITDEFAQLKKTGSCTYCHTSDVGKKKPPASHEAAVQ